jgi:hypothetical protein
VEFGWTNPVLVDAGGVVVAGHARILAARKLGLETVPVIRLGHLTPAQARAYVIADNRLALNAGWDEAMLASELRALDDDKFDLSLTGFDGGELDRLLGALEPDQTAGTVMDEDASAQAGSQTEAAAVPAVSLSERFGIPPSRLLPGLPLRPWRIRRFRETGKSRNGPRLPLFWRHGESLGVRPGATLKCLVFRSYFNLLLRSGSR